MNTILAKIVKSHWVANEHEVETLAHDRYTNAGNVSRADTSYLRVILVASQAKLGKPRGRGVKPNAKDQATVLDAVHERFYPHVLRGVTTEDIAIDDSLDPTERSRRSLERNRRSAFARSAKSTLSMYVEAGGDLRTLDPDTVSKGSLRAAVAPPEPENRVERQIQRAQGALLRACARRARGDPDGARESIETTIEALQQLLDQIGEGKPEHEAATTTIVGRAPAERATQRTRVGVPQLHRGA